MSYEPTTPFGRTVEAYHLSIDCLTNNCPPQAVDKWHALAELSAARLAHGLTDRELSTLRGLLSFHPHKLLCENGAPPVVYPSNRALSERLNGIPLSTLRRHLASLVRAGVIWRRDSPNGKRYVRRSAGDAIVFGFDLTPLATRFKEFCEVAHQVRAERDRLARLREEISLMRRDLTGLSNYGSGKRPELVLWARLSEYAGLVARKIRRKLTMEEMYEFRGKLLNCLEEARATLGELRSASNMVTCESQNERHHQNSNKESYESERGSEKKSEKNSFAAHQDGDKSGPDSSRQATQRDMPSLPLTLVLSACKQIAIFTTDPIRHWHDLFNAADRISPAIGISETAWRDAIRTFGHEEAAVVVCAILERFNEIKSPGGYLRALTAKARAGAFSSGPMLMALLARRANS